MKKRLCITALCLLAGLAQAQEWAPGNSDWSALPAIKQSKQGLYLTPQQALEMVQRDGQKVLFLDVRTRAEAMYVGMPTVVDALTPYVEHQEIMADWDDKRGMYLLEPNIDFPHEVARRLAAKGLDKQSPIILICRSGDRSAKAADLLALHGHTRVYSIPEGFEGDMGKTGTSNGRRAVNGWKNANLPWSYKLDKARMYFPAQ
jgi:rhodanese-related sulfurtransferase